MGGIGGELPLGRQAGGQSIGGAREFSGDEVDLLDPGLRDARPHLPRPELLGAGGQVDQGCGESPCLVARQRHGGGGRDHGRDTHQDHHLRHAPGHDRPEIETTTCAPEAVLTSRTTARSAGIGVPTSTVSPLSGVTWMDSGT